VYIHQLKVNLKQPFSGELWPWHQDFIYWRNEDKVPTNNIVSVMIFLDEIVEFNGPMYFIPGSHHAGCIDLQKKEGSPDGWEGDVSSSLTYQVGEQQITSLVEQGGLFSAKGNKGSAIWFDGNLVHASPPNISPLQRRIAILTYNALSNAPQDSKISRRPEFLNGLDRQPLLEVESVTII
jgi:ectoine hydroxylase